MNLSQAQLLSFGIITLASILIVVLEKLYPYEKSQKFLRDGFFNDFFWYNFVQSFVLGIVISFFIEFIDKQTSISRLQIVSGLPIWAQVALFVVVHDFYIYWMHRWMHNNKYLWRLHEAHHTPKDVDWLSGVRSHPLEILLNQTIEFAPIILLGAAPEVAAYKGVVSAVWGMWIHSNVNVRSGWLQYIINGPEMHRWHHSNDDVNAYNRNYSTKLAIWDWIFRTDYFPRERKPKEYGLGALPFPRNYFKQIVFAFRKFDKE